MNTLWLKAIRNVLDNGHRLESRDGGCTEVIGWSATLEDPRCNVVTVPERKFSSRYAAAEALWYLSGEDRIEMIKHYAPSYERFATNGIAFGAYGKRWAADEAFRTAEAHYGLSFKSQLHAAIHLLKTKPNTRQAVITMWNGGDLVQGIVGAHGDLPCTLNLILYVRNDKLYMVVNMRSNDLWLGLPYDVFCFTTIQQLAAQELNLKLGSYTHNTGSLHVYDRNLEKVQACLNTSVRHDVLPFSYERCRLDDIGPVLALEMVHRLHGTVFPTFSQTLLHDLLACVTGKRPSNPALHAHH